MSLLFSMLLRFVIEFLPRSKHLLIPWLQSPSTVILELKNIKSITASSFFPSICHEEMGPDAMILVSWMLSFKPAFHSPLSPSSRGSLVPLHFLPLELYYLHIWGCIPACDSSSPVVCNMYSACKLNKQGDNVQPCHTPFLILTQSLCSVSSSKCCFLICIEVS